VLYEVYRDAAALRAHDESAHFKLTHLPPNEGV
jgi:quinol monooxygenase YgiN